MAFYAIIYTHNLLCYECNKTNAIVDNNKSTSNNESVVGDLNRTQYLPTGLRFRREGRTKVNCLTTRDDELNERLKVKDLDRGVGTWRGGFSGP